MEYPMIIFNGSSLGVTVHEFGHQWFPMTVGSNETRYGWMDEGFDGYITDIASAHITNTPLDLSGGGGGYRRVAGSEFEAPMMWPSDFAGPYYGTQAYSKAPLALYALGGIVGDSAVMRAFAEYARSWKFKHPTPYDFFFSMNKSLGKSYDWFWYQWFFTTYTLDQGIRSVTTSGDEAIVTIYDNGDMVEPIVLKIETLEGNPTLMIYPVDVWFPGSRTIGLKIPLRGKQLKSITIDPENRFQDIDRRNNTWSKTP
jgi:hypothetical protein